MHQLILTFEDHVKLGPVSAAKLLGYEYSTYAQYKNCRRKIRPYLKAHIEAVMLLEPNVLKTLIAEAISNDGT